MRHKVIISVVSLLLVVTMSLGGYFAYKESVETKVEETKTPTLVSGNATEIADQLFDYVHIDVSDTEALTSLVNSMDFIGFEINKIDISSGFLTIDYKVGSRTKYRFIEDYNKNFNQTCATLFVLVDNLKNIRLTVSDNYGEFYSFSRDKSGFIFTDDMKDFTSDELKDASENLGNFEEFTEKLLMLKDSSSSNVYLKQIYSVLTPNLQVLENTKEQFMIALDEENLAILAGLDIDLYKHKNTSAELYFCNVEDYTISELKYYIFVFKDKKLVANDVISSPMAYENALNALK